MTKLNNTVEVFVDGGCRGNQNDNNVGAWAFTLSHNGKTHENFKATRNTTNNIQEMTAVIEALKFLKGAKKGVIVHSDSAYVVNGMNEWRHNWKSKGWKKKGGEIANLDLWKQLDDLANSFFSIKFVKVAGHSGVEGNERVDYLVNKSMDELQ